MSARRGKKNADREKKGRIFRTPLGRRIGDVVLLVLLIPVASAAAALLLVAGAAVVASWLGVALERDDTLTVAVAMVMLAFVFRSRGWPAWTLELDEDSVRMGPFPRHRVRYEDITFIAAGTRAGWLGHEDFFRYRGGWGHHHSWDAYPLRVETTSGRAITVQLKHSDADKVLLQLLERAANAAALDAEGHEHLPESGDRQAILAARTRLAAIWAPLVWLSFAVGVAVIASSVWSGLQAARDGEWGAVFGGLLIGTVGGWACGTAWWKALLRMRGHRRRVRQASTKPG